MIFFIYIRISLIKSVQKDQIILLNTLNLNYKMRYLFQQLKCIWPNFQ